MTRSQVRRQRLNIHEVAKRGSPNAQRENMMPCDRGSLAAAILWLIASGCNADSNQRPPTTTGTLAVQMTDAPLPIDSVTSVKIFVVRVDAKSTGVADAEAADPAVMSGWYTVATPNKIIDVMTLRSGSVEALGGNSAVPTDAYHSLRLVIDTDQSSIVLRNGSVLTSTSTPPVKWPSSGKIGIRVLVPQPIQVLANPATSTALIDFNLAGSFTVPGTSVATAGLVFLPEVHIKS